MTVADFLSFLVFGALCLALFALLLQVLIWLVADIVDDVRGHVRRWKKGF